MNKSTNYWITAIDIAEDESWVRLLLETRDCDGNIVELTEEIWERDAFGHFNLDVVEHGQRDNSFESLEHPHQQELINAAIDWPYEPYFFVA